MHRNPGSESDESSQITVMTDNNGIRMEVSRLGSPSHRPPPQPSIWGDSRENVAVLVLERLRLDWLGQGHIELLLYWRTVQSAQ